MSYSIRRVVYSETETAGGGIDYGVVGEDQGEWDDVQVGRNGWDRHPGECHQRSDYAYTNNLCYAGRADERYRDIPESR